MTADITLLPGLASASPTVSDTEDLDRLGQTSECEEPTSSPFLSILAYWLGLAASHTVPLTPNMEATQTPTNTSAEFPHLETYQNAQPIKDSPNTQVLVTSPVELFARHGLNRVTFEIEAVPEAYCKTVGHFFFPESPSQQTGAAPPELAQFLCNDAHSISLELPQSITIPPSPSHLDELSLVNKTLGAVPLASRPPLSNDLLKNSQILVPIRVGDLSMSSSGTANATRPLIVDHPPAHPTYQPMITPLPPPPQGYYMLVTPQLAMLERENVHHPGLEPSDPPTPSQGPLQFVTPIEDGTLKYTTPPPPDKSIRLPEEPRELQVYHQLVNSIREHLSQTNRENPIRLVLHLDPPDLGQVEVYMHFQGKDVEMQFRVEQQSTQVLLEHQRTQLEDTLAHIGINVKSTVISFQGHESRQGRFAEDHQDLPIKKSKRPTIEDKSATASPNSGELDIMA